MLRKLVNHKEDIQVENIVARAKLSLPVDLELVSKKRTQIKELTVNYEPEQFSGLVIKSPDKSFTCLLFANGKMIATGARSKREIKEGIKKLSSFLTRITETDISMENIEVVNVVAKKRLERKIDIEKTLSLSKNVQYEPEQFAGVVIRRKSSKTIILFHTGLIVSVGTKKVNEAKKAIKDTINQLENLEALFD